MISRRIRDMFGREGQWKLVSSISGMLGAMVAEKLMSAGYRAIRKNTSPDSPFDPADSLFSWSTTLRWAAAGGIGLGVAKVVSARIAAVGWTAATHTLPPGAEESAAS